MGVIFIFGFLVKEVVVFIMVIIYVVGESLFGSIVSIFYILFLVYCFMLFILFYILCLVIVVVICKEISLWKWIVFVVVYLFVIVYVLVFFVY